MAVIGKIRERGGLLVGIVLVSLALFILGDWLAGRGSGRTDQVLGEVGGAEIGVMEYERRVNDEVESYRNEIGQPASQQLTDQVRNQVWNEMVKSLSMMDQVKDAGFALTKAEYDDIRFGENIAPEFRGQFSGPDGQPDRTQLKDYFERVAVNAPMYHQIQSRRIQENRLYSKYTTLVKKSVFVNSAQARDEYNGKNRKAAFTFVAKRYDSEPDSLYPVSDRDLRRYYDEHKNEPKHRQKSARGFDFVLFPVKASERDRDALRTEMMDLRAAFESATDDSVFVVANSSTRSYTKAPYTDGAADAENDELIRNAEVGAVVGPYLEGENWKLVKVKELADVPEARVRHILLSTQKEKAEDEQKRRADSLLAVVKKDRSKFEAMVTKFSDDPGSVSNGGVYEWFDKQRMVPEFTAASFDQKVGAITICKTSFGFHIVEVLGQRSRQERRIVTVDRPVKPSGATFKSVYKEANEFSLTSKTLEAVRKAAEEKGLQVTTVDDFRADSRFVQGLQQPAGVIGWVNRAKVGDVSDPKESGENYVVAVLKAIKEEGPPSLDDVRDAFTKEVAKEKKAEAYMAKLQGKSDLSAAASEIGGRLETANDLLYNVFSLPGGYTEYEVIGKVFALSNGQTSVPLKGETAVYTVNMGTKTEAFEGADVEAERTSIRSRLQGRAETSVANALREAAKVIDNRYMFY